MYFAYVCLCMRACVFSLPLALEAGQRHSPIRTSTAKLTPEIPYHLQHESASASMHCSWEQCNGPRRAGRSLPEAACPNHCLGHCCRTQRRPARRRRRAALAPEAEIANHPTSASPARRAYRCCPVCPFLAARARPRLRAGTKRAFVATFGF